MGGNFFQIITAWTLLCLVIFLRTVTTENDLVHDLGLNLFPDAAKINISLEEYTTMMGVYFAAKENSVDAQSIPKLITFNLERKDWWENDNTIIKLKFPITKTKDEIDLESAQLRLLMPPQEDETVQIRVQVSQVVGKRKRRFLGEAVLYLAPNLTKWCELDITSVVKNWFDGERNLGVELICKSCRSSIYPLEAAVTALVHPESRRLKRSYEVGGPTDCREGPGKKKCCRHQMDVVLKEVMPRSSGISTIYYPASYDAGFCQGICPKNYNHATNHSRIQSLMHQLNRKNRTKNPNGKMIPKACCAPSKLVPLDILRADPENSSKLKLEVWNNMKVVECSCS